MIYLRKDAVTLLSKENEHRKKTEMQETLPSKLGDWRAGIRAAAKKGGKKEKGRISASGRKKASSR